MTDRCHASLPIGLSSFEEILDATSDALFIHDEQGEILWVNARTCSMFGYTKEQLLTKRVSELSQDAPPFTQSEAIAKVQNAKKFGYCSFPWRSKRKSGELFWSEVALKSSTISGQSCIIASVRDIDDRNKAEESLRTSEAILSSIFRNSSNGLALTALDGRIVDVNAEWLRSTGIVHADALGKTALELGLWDHPEAREFCTAQLAEKGMVRDCDTTLLMRGIPVAYLISAEKLEIRDLHYVLWEFKDIDERKRADLALRRLNRNLQMLSDCNQALVRATDENTLLRDVCRLVCEKGGYLFAWAGYAETDEEKTIRIAARGGVDNDYLARARLTWSESERGRGPAGICIRTGTSVTINDFSSDSSVAPWRDDALERGYQAAIAMPLLDDQGRAYGALTIYSGETACFSSEESRLLQELTGDLSFGIMTLRNIKARHQAERKLLESETLLRDAQTVAKMGYWTVELTTGVVEFSDELCRIYKCNKTESSLEYFKSIIHPEDRESTVAQVGQAISQGRPWILEHRIVLQDGTLKWVQSRGEVRKFGPTQHVLAVGTVQDVTEQKQAQQAILEGDDRFSLAMDVGNAGLWEWNPKNDSVKFDDRFLRILGYGPEELPSDLEEWLSYHHKDDLPIFMEKARAYLNGQSPIYESEHRIRTKSGTWAWLFTRGRFVGPKVDGKHERFVGIAMNVTEHKAQEEALRNSEHQLRTITDNIPACVAYVSCDELRYQFVNQAYSDAFGIPAHDMLGKKVIEIIGQEAYQRALPYIEKALSGHRVSYENRIPTQGEERWYSVSYIPGPANDHQKRSLVVLSVDITERKRAEQALSESERRLSLAISATADAVWEWDLETGETFYSTRWYEMLGYQDKAFPMSFQTWIDLCHPDDYQRTLVEIQAVIQDPNSPGYVIEFRMRRSDGTWAWIQGRGNVVERNSEGKPVVLSGTNTDITERKRAEELLKVSELKFSTVFHANPLPMAIRTVRDNRFLECNQSLEELSGYSRDEVIGRTPQDLGFYLDPTLLDKINQALLTEGRIRNLEVQYVPRTGHVLTCLLSSESFELAGEECAISTVLDITDRKRAEEALRESETRIKSISNSFTEGMIYQLIASPDGSRKFTYLSDSVRQLYGIEPEAGLQDAHLIYGRIHEDDLARLQESETDAICSLSVFRAEVRVRNPAGDFRWSSLVSSPRKMDDGSICFDGLEFVITERKRAEDALMRSEAQLRSAQRIAHLGSWEQDLLTNGIVWSDETYRIFEMDKHTDHPTYEGFLATIHPSDRESVAATHAESIRTRSSAEITHRIQLPDGRIKHVREQYETHFGPDDKPIRTVGTIQDITAQRRLEDQARQSQKMEAIGQLAGGVAHDFNNILLAFMMQLELLRMTHNNDPDLMQGLNELDFSAQRAANLTRQLLMFSRRSVLEVRTLNLNDVVANLLNMLGRLLGEDITFVAQRKTAIPSVEADAGMLEQVLMNLAVNARDAMPRGGRITLATEAVNVSVEEAATNPDRRPGRYVCLSVSDTGMGMDAPTLKRVFEPFFTTKGVGKGTGLGLATVYGIVAQHRGWIDVESQLGAGTTFRVYLPASSKLPIEPAEQASETVPKGRETIMVVEDDSKVRHVLAQNLRTLGYRVLEAKNGQDALRLWRETGQQIDLLFTDMVMPEGISGLELAERICAENPSVKIIISSGYSAETALKGKAQLSGITYLPKPYQVSVLGKTIRECLDAK